VRQRYIDRCDHAAWALYLVLVTVADAEGLSYYSAASLERMLRLDHAGLHTARAQLCQAGLVVYQPPLYQVLALEDTVPVAPPAPRANQPRSVETILAQILAQGGRP
jgi:hypothetical protein